VVALLTALLMASCASTPAAPTAAPTLASVPEPTPTASAGATREPVERGLTYCTADGVPLRADVYHARSASGPAPLVLFLHGGGWTGGSRTDSTGLGVEQLLTEAGFTVASVDYRLAPQTKMPAIVEDVKCAVRSFRARAEEFGIDPDHIGVIGVSAGAHLGALLGTSDETAGFDTGEYAGVSSRVQAVVDLAGPADLTNPAMPYAFHLADQVFGTQDFTDPRFAAASPVTWITPDDPPFLILHGDADDNVPLSQSQTLYDALSAAGVDARLIVVEGGGHSLTTPGQSPSTAELAAVVLGFLEEHLK